MSKVTAKTAPTTTDPRLPSSAPVNVTDSIGSGDQVRVQTPEKSTKTVDGSTYAVVVMSITADSTPSLTINGTGGVDITASGNRNTYYTELTLNTADPNNWTVNAGTSGGSTYQFKKGSGGGGHAMAEGYQEKLTEKA